MDHTSAARTLNSSQQLTLMKFAFCDRVFGGSILSNHCAERLLDLIFSTCYDFIQKRFKLVTRTLHIARFQQLHFLIFNDFM